MAESILRMLDEIREIIVADKKSGKDRSPTPATPASTAAASGATEVGKERRRFVRPKPMATTHKAITDRDESDDRPGKSTFRTIGPKR